MKYLVIVISLFLTTNLTSQVGVSSPSDPVTPSASAGSFGKYADVPVNLYTGTPSVSIPIYSVSEGPLSHSISLSYHASGNRVSDVASSVGLGWNLNAGGIVTRIVQGIPDDKNSSNLQGYFTSHTAVSTSPAWRKDAAEGKKDPQPDIYTVAAPGLGTFKFTYDGQLNIQTFPRSKVKVQGKFGTCGMLMGFHIQSEDGTNFWFGIDPEDGQPSCSNIYQNSPQVYFESWHLEKIVSSDERHEIDFEYVNSDYTYKVLLPCTAVVYGGGEQEENCDDIDDQVIEIRDRVLSSISTSTSSVSVDHFIRDDLENSQTFNILGQTTPTTPKGIDRININEGSFSTKYELYHGYFEDSNGTGVEAKRLRLDSVKLISNTDASYSEPAHIFDYYNGGTFFPHRLSSRIDHWGFYNGAVTNDGLDNLIPLTSVVTSSGAYSYGGASRHTSNDNMLFGQLTRVTYPLGGTTDFTYEANEFKKPGYVPIPLINDLESCDGAGSTCCGVNDNEKTIPLTQSMIDSSSLLFSLDVLTSSPCFSGASKSIDLKIYDVTTGGSAPVYQINCNDTISSSMTITLSAISGLVANHSYRFRIESTFCRARLSVLYYKDGSNSKCGGLRIKQMKTHDGISLLNDIIRSYKYQDQQDTTLSSGIIYNQPVYGYEIENKGIFKSSSVIPLGGFDGYHIGYRDVVEDHHGNGTIYHQFYTDDAVNIYNHYPAIPPTYRPKEATQKSSEIRNENGNVEQSSATFLDSVNNLEVTLSGLRYVVDNLSSFSSLSNKYPHTAYALKTDLERPVQQNATNNGVTTSTTYKYNSANLYFNPQQVKMTNSDGTTYSTDYRYTIEYPHNAAVQDTFEARNIISIPYQTIQSFGASDTQIGGSRVIYRMFKANGGFGTGVGADPYPRAIQEYQRTWANGSLGSGTWTNELILVNYTPEGLPKTERATGWSKNTTYTYLNKQLTSKTYDGHKSKYLYHPGTRLLERSTNVDQTYIDYSYDPLMRLSSTISSCNDAEATYTYHYSSNPTIRSYTKTITDVVADPNGLSDVDVLESRTYFDGLGRTIQTNRVNQTQDGVNDIISAVAYDNQGRSFKTYDTQQNDGDGDYVSPLSSWKYALTTYEPSPLSRFSSTTPIDWYTSYTYYTPNFAPDLVINHSTSAFYPSFSLTKTTQDDANDNKLITFTDKRGRTVLQRRVDKDGDNPADTYTLYDDKDRPTMVIPPGATKDSTDLIFTYEYDKEDNVVKKKIPGKSLMEYRYSTKRLLAASQDGYLKDRGLWYTYNYDGRGRELSSGFYDGTPAASGTIGNISPTEELMTTTYGTSLFERDKVVSSTSKILETDSWLSQTIQYHACGQAETITSNNHLDLSLTDVSTNIYDGAQQLIRSTLNHSTPGHTHTIISSQHLDHTGRPESSIINIDGTSTTLNQMTYDYKDRLITHKVGITSSGQLQECNYDYKDNDLLNGVNIDAGHSADDLFSMTLKYDQVFSGTAPTIRKNGDIINTVWKTKGGNNRIYSYEYDYLDRLTSATYKQTGLNNKYNTSYSYEGRRGRLNTVTREGYELNNGVLQSGQIDNINISYAGNQIQSVHESASGSLGAEGYNSGTGGTYQYDTNGNLKKDPAKDITISYNHLDLPDTILYDDGRLIAFLYDAGGTILQKKIYLDASTMVEKRDYLGPLEYVNNELESIYHAEGRAYQSGFFPDSLYIIEDLYGSNLYQSHHLYSISDVQDFPLATDVTFKADQEIVLNEGFEVETSSVFEAYTSVNTSGGWQHEYTISDHLGNARLVYGDKNNDGQITTSEIIQENHYYPFGLKQKGVWQKAVDPISYQYNGIEHLDEFDLNVNMATYRTLDPTLGQWWNVDPKSESVMSLSPFQSMGNNPVSNVDPDGDIFFAIPRISFSGGFSFGLEVGIGIPGEISASISGSVGANGGYASIQGTVGPAHAGIGTEGPFAGVGFNAGPFNFGGGVSQSGGWSVNAGVGDNNGSNLGLSYDQKTGIGINGTLSQTHQFYLQSVEKRYLATFTDPSNIDGAVAYHNGCPGCPPGVTLSDLPPSWQVAIGAGAYVLTDELGNIAGVAYPGSSEMLNSSGEGGTLAHLGNYFFALGTLRIGGAWGTRYIKVNGKWNKFKLLKEHPKTDFSKMTAGRGLPWDPKIPQPRKTWWSSLLELIHQIGS